MSNFKQKVGQINYHKNLIFRNFPIIIYMKRGFNRYGDNAEEQSHSDQGDNNQSNSLSNPNFGIINQFSNFNVGGTLSDGIIMTLFQIIEQQSQALQGLMGKVQRVTLKTVELTQKIKELKKSRHDERDNCHDQTKKECIKGETVKGAGDILEAPALIRILFGAEKRYEYKLQLAQKLELPLYRERNFSLEIQLKDFDGNSVKNCNKIPLSLALYSSENPPKFIEKNTAGQKILKGYVEQSLHQGICRFQKIQIKEVTSHFRNGWIFIVIIPSMTPLGSANAGSESFIDYTQIEPLVLERVIVKAKKLKEPRRGGERQCGAEDMEAEAEVEPQMEDEHKCEDPIYSEEK